MELLPEHCRTFLWFLELPNNWSNLYVFKSGFSTVAAQSYTYFTGQTLDDDASVWNEIFPYLKSYKDLANHKMFIVWRDPIERCMSLYNEMLHCPETHPKLRKKIRLDSVQQFITDYVICRDVHSKPIFWSIDKLALNPSDITFVPLDRLEIFSRNELGFTGEWKPKNVSGTSAKLSNSVKQLFQNNGILKRFFHNDYLLYKNVRPY